MANRTCSLLVVLVVAGIVPVGVAAERAAPPVRDPRSPGYVDAIELPAGALPPIDAVGNFIIGPEPPDAPETERRDGVPPGKVTEFTMRSADSKLYPGVARDPNVSAQVDPDDPAKLINVASNPAPYERKVAVYVPANYQPGTKAPFIVGADGPDWLLF